MKWAELFWMSQIKWNSVLWLLDIWASAAQSEDLHPMACPGTNTPSYHQTLAFELCTGNKLEGPHSLPTHHPQILNTICNMTHHAKRHSVHLQWAQAQFMNGCCSWQMCFKVFLYGCSAVFSVGFCPLSRRDSVRFSKTFDTKHLQVYETRGIRTVLVELFAHTVFHNVMPHTPHPAFRMRLSCSWLISCDSWIMFYRSTFTWGMFWPRASEHSSTSSIFCCLCFNLLSLFQLCLKCVASVTFRASKYEKKNQRR